MSTHPLCLAARAAVTLAVLALAGCGGAATPEPAVPAAGPAAPTAAPAKAAEVTSASPVSPEDAAGDLDRAEAELLAVLGPQPQYAQAPSTAAQGGVAQPGAAGAARPAQPAPPPPPAAPRSPEGSASPKSAPRAEAYSESPCTTACRALASMERAAEHLCDLSGSDNARCDSARSRVKNATERVYAQCPSCAS